MSNTILDIEIRIQRAIYAFDNDICENLSQAASCMVFPTNVFKLNIIDVLFVLAEQQHTKSYLMP